LSPIRLALVHTWLETVNSTRTALFPLQNDGQAVNTFVYSHILASILSDYRMADECCLFSESSGPTAGVSQVLFDEFSEAESLVEFPHQNQSAVGGYAGTLEIDLESGIEGELKGLILYLTHWVLTSGASSSRIHPHKY